MAKEPKKPNRKRLKLGAEFFPGLAQLVDDVNDHERRLNNLEHHEGVERRAILHARDLLVHGDHGGALSVLEKALNDS